jgi:hypothetical protein
LSSEQNPRETVQSFDNGQRSYSFQDIFAECLSVNERLRKVMADVETAALTETDASTGGRNMSILNLAMMQPVPVTALIEIPFSFY